MLLCCAARAAGIPIGGVALINSLTAWSSKSMVASYFAWFCAMSANVLFLCIFVNILVVGSVGVPICCEMARVCHLYRSVSFLV